MNYARGGERKRVRRGLIFRGLSRKPGILKQRPTVERINPDLAVAKAIATWASGSTFSRSVTWWSGKSISEGRVEEPIKDGQSQMRHAYFIDIGESETDAKCVRRVQFLKGIDLAAEVASRFLHPREETFQVVNHGLPYPSARNGNGTSVSSTSRSFAWEKRAGNPLWAR